MALDAYDLHGLVLVRDCLGADGAFVLAHILKLALGLDGVHNAVLVAARHTAPHYASVLRRSGLQMLQLVERGRLAVVDALRAPQDPAQQLTSLRALHKRVAKAAAALSAHTDPRPLLVVLDDLTALHCAAEDLEEWPAFLHACTSLPSAAGQPGCVLALAHGDVAEDEGWLSRLEHAASTVADVEDLETGRSTEVSGRLSVCRRDGPVPPYGKAGGEEERHMRLGVEHWQYRLAEGGARLVRQTHR